MGLKINPLSIVEDTLRMVYYGIAPRMPYRVTWVAQSLGIILVGSADRNGEASLTHSTTGRLSASFPLRGPF